jgi:Uma2 family endonuclease
VNAVRVRLQCDVCYYPDVVVACGEPCHPHEEESSCLVVEVLSPSARAIDLRKKPMSCRRRHSVQAHVVVHQYEPRVERHHREASGAWQYEDVTVAGNVRVPCPEATVTLDEIYDGVKREAGGYWPRPRRLREPHLLFYA